MKKELFILGACLFFLVGASKSLAQDDPFARFVNTGLKYSKQEQYNAAIREFDLALTISDTSAQVYYFKGLCYFMLKDLENSIQSFEAAVKRNNAHINSYAKLLTCYKRAKDVQNLIHTYNRMFEILEDPKKKVEIKMFTTRIWLSEDEVDKALQEVDAGLNLDPNNVTLLYYKGKIQNERQQYLEAEEILTKATTVLDWRDMRMKTQVNYELGYAYHKLGKYKASLEAFRNANYGPYKARVAMFTPSFYAAVAYTTSTMHDYQKATELVDIALAMEPDFEAAIELRKKIVALSGDHSAEVDAYKKVLTAPELDDVRRQEIYTKAIDLLIGSQKYQDAIALADQALAKYPKFNSIRFMKGMALLQAKRFDEAIAQLNSLASAGDATPAEISKYELGIGLCFMGKNDLHKAHQYFSKVVKQASEGTQIYVKAAMFERNQLDIDMDEEEAGQQPQEGAGVAGGEK